VSIFRFFTGAGFIGFSCAAFALGFGGPLIRGFGGLFIRGFGGTFIEDFGKLTFIEDFGKILIKPDPDDALSGSFSIQNK